MRRGPIGRAAIQADAAMRRPHRSRWGTDDVRLTRFAIGMSLHVFHVKRPDRVPELLVKLGGPPTGRISARRVKAGPEVA